MLAIVRRGFDAAAAAERLAPGLRRAAAARRPEEPAAVVMPSEWSAISSSSLIDAMVRWMKRVDLFLTIGCGSFRSTTKNKVN